MFESSIKRVKIVYFSGTGSTSRVADCFEKALQDRGLSISKYEIRFGNGSSSEGWNEDLLIVLFAVHAFNAPEPIYEWIKETPQVNQIPALVVSVSGGGEISPNTACRAGTIVRLSKKGYNVVYEQMLIMPSNIVVPTHDGLAIRLLNILPIKVERIVDDLLSGTRRRTNPLLFDRYLSVLGEMEKLGAHYFGRMIRASDACNGCGWCARSCPHANISLEQNRPRFGMRCVFCLKCIYGCPTHALKPGIMKFVVIKTGYNLNDVELRMAGVEPDPVEKLAKGVLWKGVKSYLLETEIK